MMENSLRLSFYLGSSILILDFSYPDSRLSGLFNPVAMSPNNWDSTALIIVIKPAASIFLLLVNYHILLLEMVFVPDKSTIQKIKCNHMSKTLYQSSHKSLFRVKLVSYVKQQYHLHYIGFVYMASILNAQPPYVRPETEQCGGLYTAIDICSPTQTGGISWDSLSCDWHLDGYEPNQSRYKLSEFEYESTEYKKSVDKTQLDTVNSTLKTWRSLKFFCHTFSSSFSKLETVSFNWGSQSKVSFPSD